MKDDFTIPYVEPTEENTDDIDLKDEDELMAQKINLRWRDGQGLHDLACKNAKENLKIFQGKIDEVDDDEILATYKSKSMVNRVFLTIRNMVGLATDRASRAFVVPSKNTEKSIERAKKVEMGLEYGMERIQYQNLLALSLFNTWIKGDSYQHWFWDYDKNDFNLVNVDIEDIFLSPEATDIQSAEYLIYAPKKNRKWWKDNYPKEYNQIKFEQLDNAQTTTYNEDSTQTTSLKINQRLVQYWQNDIVISMVKGKEGKDIILEKKQNPYYEFRSEEEQLNDWAKEARPEAVAEAEMADVPTDKVLPEEDIDAFSPIYNFLPEPRKPFIQISGIKLDGHAYSTNLIGELKEVFLDMNKKKRQISDNLRGCNVKWIVDNNTFSGEESAKITDEPNQVIEADFQSNPKPVYAEQGTNFEIDKIMTDIYHDEQYIDDVFGHHDISRGAGASPTLGQDQMNYESDKTPIRQQVRNTELAIKEIWEGWIQLMKMFYTDKHYIKRFGAKGGLEMVELMNDEIEDGIEPILKPASTMPMNKVAKAEQELRLWESGATDPYSLYVALDEIDPEERSNRLTNWLNFNLISDEDPEEVMADMQPHQGTEGDMTMDPIEMAEQENKAVQSGQEVPPTSPEYVTPEHVKMHYAFIKDPNREMEEEDYHMLLAHAEVDKATLARKITMGAAEEPPMQAQEEEPVEQPKANPKTKSEGEKE